MPTNNPSTPKDHYYAAGDFIYERRDGLSRAVFRTSDWDAEGNPLGLARVAQVLNDAEEYPWTDDGPSVAEAGGNHVLVRFEGQLRHAQRLDGRWRGFLMTCQPVLGVAPYIPDGWRRMPKAKE